jgi:predicted TIM-barrel fold metal-dependent hydrolase
VTGTMLTNPDYRADEVLLTETDRDARRQLEKSRRKLLEHHRTYQLVDADQHYYEPDDCFTRHLETSYRDQAIEVRRDHSDGRGRVYLAGHRFRHVRGPAGEDVARPGTLRDYFKSKGRDISTDHEGIDGLSVPEFSDKAARLRAMDDQEVQATLILPSLGLLVENECCRTVEPDVWFALMRSFNRWVEEDWGYGDDGRIFGVPLVSLFDPELAVVELDRLISVGAKVVLMRAGPVYGRSPADTIFDPFWDRVEEAGIVVAFHLGDFGYLDFYAREWGYGNEPFPVGAGNPFETFTCGTDRAMPDTLAALIFGNLFGRFPGLRCLIIELGASWLPATLKKMDMVWRTPNRSRVPRLEEAPSTIYKRHFWITPYYEDPWDEIIHAVGAERVLLGSDWPHPEGLPEPLDILEDIGVVPPEELRLILRDNTASLLGVD